MYERLTGRGTHYMELESASVIECEYVWMYDDRHRYLRVDALHWLMLVGDSWERLLDSREYERAFQASPDTPGIPDAFRTPIPK